MTQLRLIRRAGRSYDATPRQLWFLGLIESFISTNGYAPTIRELAGLAGIRSTNGVADYLKALARKGHIQWHPYRARTVRVLRPVEQTVRIANTAR